jgi:hypothetical protein
VNVSSSNNKNVAVYFILGQVGWFACVLSAARGESWLGIGVAAVLVAMHLWRVPRPLEEVKLLLAVMVIGGSWESVVVKCGLLTYPSSMSIDGLAPAWLPALWVVFAAQINTTYVWLKTRLIAASLLGMVAGPLSFRAGAALGALHFAKPVPAFGTLAVGWGVLLPGVILLSRRWDGVLGQAPSELNDGIKTV